MLNSLRCLVCSTLLIKASTLFLPIPFTLMDIFVLGEPIITKFFCVNQNRNKNIKAVKMSPPNIPPSPLLIQKRPEIMHVTAIISNKIVLLL